MNDEKMTRPMCIKWLKWLQNCTVKDSEQYKALQFAINSLETDEAYQLLYENAKVVTTEQLEEMYEKFQKRLWHEHEDVMGNDVVELGFAEQSLQNYLVEFGCWEKETEDNNA